MKVQTDPKYKCDRCGVIYHTQSSSSYSHVSFDYSVRAYDGAWGGSNMKLDLCSNCSEIIRKALQPVR